MLSLMLSSKQWPLERVFFQCFAAPSAVIKDEETGFFLRDNLRGCTAADIVDTLSDLTSKKIAINTQVSLEVSNVQNEQNFGNANRAHLIGAVPRSAH
jgi:hypothetical protein